MVCPNTAAIVMNAGSCAWWDSGSVWVICQLVRRSVCAVPTRWRIRSWSWWERRRRKLVKMRRVIVRVHNSLLCLIILSPGVNVMRISMRAVEVGGRELYGTIKDVS